MGLITLRQSNCAFLSRRLELALGLNCRHSSVNRYSSGKRTDQRVGLPSTCWYNDGLSNGVGNNRDCRREFLWFLCKSLRERDFSTMTNRFSLRKKEVHIIGWSTVVELSVGIAILNLPIITHIVALKSSPVVWGTWFSLQLSSVWLPVINNL